MHGCEQQLPNRHIPHPSCCRGRTTDILNLGHFVHVARVLIADQVVLHELGLVIQVLVLELPPIARELFELAHGLGDEVEGDPGRVVLIHGDRRGQAVVADMAVAAIGAVGQ